MSPESSWVETLIPKAAVLGGGAFKWWLGHEGVSKLFGNLMKPFGPRKMLIPTYTYYFANDFTGRDFQIKDR